MLEGALRHSEPQFGVMHVSVEEAVMLEGALRHSTYLRLHISRVS